MGSLMAGWDSHVPDQKSVVYQRNRSFTKGEIEAYWKSRKRTEEEHLKAISNVLENSQESLYSGSGATLERSSSLPVTNTEVNFLVADPKADLEMLKKTNAWWTRSNWAFLNEPPVTAMEGPAYKYAAQYHVADVHKSKPEAHSVIKT
ncbi:hypothetical protein AAC387_Pa05g2718 [Persea americana]|eukprot:TRINITY_DN7739_c0_g2_i1.p1 TRINITY_DN7739_c0_g2~~TRINITY_DN7739_c0_g2_i1.p1  ORF type:complete len:148 (+),score=30.35 TRINITY_DN7739_c0_g2_i1:148-591(+)